MAWQLIPPAAALSSLPDALGSGLSPDFTSATLLGSIITLRQCVLREPLPGSAERIVAGPLTPVPTVTWRNPYGDEPAYIPCLTLWVRARGKGGIEDKLELGQYTMDEACDGK